MWSQQNGGLLVAHIAISEAANSARALGKPV